MLNNVFGVDLDYQAVEVTMLSLYLKILEGETRTTLGKQHTLFPRETFLPDLSANIKCGNSLIGSDFCSDEQLSLLGPSDNSRVNAFDWASEFPAVSSGGFDAVVSCLSWNWRGRSSVKITERTHAKRAQALHGGREGCHPEAALVG